MVSVSPVHPVPTRWCFEAPTTCHTPRRERHRVKNPWLVGAVTGLGAVGGAMLQVVPAQAAPVEFPDGVTVTGDIPDDAGFDRAAAEANNWTFTWATDANGVLTFTYADGTTSSTDQQQAAADVRPTALWSPADHQSESAAVTPDAGVSDLATVASEPFGAPPAQRVADAQTVNPSDQSIVNTAYQGLGGAYVWGGTDYMAWDCSGFVQWVYAQHGINIPRVTWDQFAAARPTAQPQPGDLVSQNNGAHVGIFLGGDQMISALNPQEGTIVHSIHTMPLDGFYTYR